ncbi:MAG: cardiolipin synthase ClsB [Burkholderiaceae bacterium]|nr:cardiolipin synthase ClsB [Burkholderiaceae bacterium]
MSGRRAAASGKARLRDDGEGVELVALPAAGDEVSLSWYKSLKPRMRRGHEIELLESGAQYFPALERAIDEACASVYLETYIFEDDRTGRRIGAALVRAAQRGIRVHVVVDGFGTALIDPLRAQALREAGVLLEVFRPDLRRYSLDRQRLRRMHRKMAVVDGAVAFVGGINVLDDYNDPNHGALEHPRLDYAVRVRGPLVAQAHVAAARLWWETATVNRVAHGGKELSARELLQLPAKVRSDVASSGNVRAALMLRDNLRHRRTIERAYLRAIGRARGEVLIACAYFFPGGRFRRALKSAVRRGVRVRLLLQGRVEYRLQYYASQALYEPWLREGIEIVEYRRSFLHAKVAVIDDWATVGSSNIDPFSLLLAREANVAVQDAGFARLLRERLDRAIDEGGERVMLQSYTSRPWPVRMMNRISLVLVRLAVALTGRGADY